jgi:hypothetical protein
MVAIADGHAETARILVELGADVDQADEVRKSGGMINDMLLIGHIRDRV